MKMNLNQQGKVTGILIVFHLLLASEAVHAQQEKSVRLSPVWVRVADLYGEYGSVESAEFSKDNRYIVSGTKFDNQVVMWRTSDGTELWRAETDEEIERVGWAPDGSVVASCSEDYLVRIYDAKSGELLKKLQHTQGIDALTWSNNGTWLATGEEESGEGVGKIRVFKMPGGTLQYEVNHGATVNSLHFSSDDKYIVSTGDNSEARVWDVQNKMELVKTFKADEKEGGVTVRFSPDDKYVVSSGFYGEIYVWEVASGRKIRQFNNTGQKIETIDFTPDGKYLLTAGNDPYIRILRMETILDEAMKRIPVAWQSDVIDGAEYLDFNSDGSFLVSAHQDGTIRLWNFMSEDPNINRLQHSMVKKRQDKNMRGEKN